MGLRSGRAYEAGSATASICRGVQRTSRIGTTDNLPSVNQGHERSMSAKQAMGESIKKVTAHMMMGGPRDEAG